MPAPATRSSRRKARTEQAILDAAERHFLERGLEDARVDEIAEEADVAVGSVYNHFGSKDALYIALVERAAALLDTYMENEIEGTPLERLLDVAGRVARFGREQPAHLRLLALPPPRHAAIADAVAAVDRRMAAHERSTAALIEAAVRTGTARPVDSRAAASFLWSAWKGVLALGPTDDRRRRAALEAGLRITIGGIASDEVRGNDEAVRAVLETGVSASGDGEPALRRAPVLGDLRERFPELSVWTAETRSPGGAAEQGVRARLAAAAGERAESAAWAYRVLLRRLAHEPGPHLSPAEQIALSRQEVASLEAEGLPADALTLAALQTGVPVLAFDAAALEGELALRPAREGEEIDGEPLEEGEVVLADLERPLLALFGPRAPDAMAGPDTERVVLAAIQAKGIAPVSVEEALWTSVEILRGA